MHRPPLPPPSPFLWGAGDGEGTVGEPFAIAPGTFVVPGRWPDRPGQPGLVSRSLVVRSRSTVVVDTAPAPLAHDWLAAVLALVDPAEVRWVVLTALDPARAGGVADLLAACPRATVVAPGSGTTTLDLGGETITVHDGTGPTGPGLAPSPLAGPERLVVDLPQRRTLWCDAVSGAWVGPATDVGLLTDSELRAGLAHRSRTVTAEEIAHLAGLDLRTLASPVGPLARGLGIARALALLAETADAPTTTVVADLIARLGSPPAWAASCTATPRPS